MAALHAGEHVPLGVTDADMGGPAILFLLGDVEIAVLAASDVIGAAHASPLPDEGALRGEDLDALVGAVCDVEQTLIVESDAVRQMELARALARLAPGGNEAPARGEAVHAGVAIAVGHIEIAIGVGD